MLEGDTFVKQNGIWYEKRIWNKKIFNDTEDIVSYGVFAEHNLFYLLKNLEDADYTKGKEVILKSNIFKGVENDLFNRPGQEGGMQDCQARIRSTDGRLYFNLDKFSTAEEVKTYFKEMYDAGTPVYVDYILAKPLLLPCTSQQTTILNEIEQTAHTYKGTTHIFSADEVSPIFNTIYKKDIASIDDRITALEKAISESGVG